MAGQLPNAKIVPAEIQPIAAAAQWADSGEIDVILCTGGISLAPRDVTPEALRSVAPRGAPDFGEVMPPQVR